MKRSHNNPFIKKKRTTYSQDEVQDVNSGCHWFIHPMFTEHGPPSDRTAHLQTVQTVRGELGLHSAEQQRKKHSEASARLQNGNVLTDLQGFCMARQNNRHLGCQTSSELTCPAGPSVSPIGTVTSVTTSWLLCPRQPWSLLLCLV